MECNACNGTGKDPCAEWHTSPGLHVCVECEGKGTRQPSGLYYVQDARQHVGNSMLWHAKDHKGYVCDIRKAHVWKESELKSLRITDIPWPVEYINARISHHIDAQHCDADFAKR